MITTFQGSVPTPTCVLSTEVEPTVYLKSEFLGLAVVAVLLQVADGEFFQRKSPLRTKQQKALSSLDKKKNTFSFTQQKHSPQHFPFAVMLYLSQLFGSKC